MIWWFIINFCCLTKPRGRSWHSYIHFVSKSHDHRSSTFNSCAPLELATFNFRIRLQISYPAILSQIMWLFWAAPHLVFDSKYRKFWMTYTFNGRRGLTTPTGVRERWQAAPEILFRLPNSWKLTTSWSIWGFFPLSSNGHLVPWHRIVKGNRALPSKRIFWWCRSPTAGSINLTWDIYFPLHWRLSVARHI